ncbi:MAG: acyl-CoA dehydrogenase family protein [Nocardioides sp.]|uniref:acyl-CoA dehydrogenase family protein n=1 Tax=Nocardioides sp. TaxID=35761 RepID=UPI0039E5A969
MSAPTLEASAKAVRADVRAAIAAAPRFDAQPDAWLFGHNPAFTATLAERGLIGITWPTEYGGRNGSATDRLVATEELLRAGAPVAAHWIADRQIGPAILRYGSPELRAEFLPRIVSGDYTFCLGMSETESGSDLAAVRTKAVPVEGGYRITGRKIWTSNAHRSTHAYVLARVPGGESKYDGLTEFIVDLAAPGIEVRPIRDMVGEHHFNETILEDVFVPADRVIGTIGDGWKQVTEQLSFERGGVERVLSTYPILDRLLADEAIGLGREAVFGRLVARLHALRGLALSVARTVDEGGAPVRRAAMLKYLGTSFEAEVVEFGRDVLGGVVRPDRSALDRLVGQGLTRTPGATLRGGTTEVLLGILARERFSIGPDGDLAALVDEVLVPLATGEPIAAPADVWHTAVELGWSGVGVDDERGGSGGELADLSTIVRGLARAGLSAPVGDSALAAAVIAERTDVDVSVPRALSVEPGLRLETTETGQVLNGRVEAVCWAPFAREAVLAATGETGPVLVRLALDQPGLGVSLAADLADEPLADLTLSDVAIPETDVLGGTELVARIRAAQQVLWTAGLVGAMESAVALATEHAKTRAQFGKPLQAFQAVAQHLARMAAEVALSEQSLGLAIEATGRHAGSARALAAHVQAGQSAGLVASSAHQVLGAMGMTSEHRLHRATLRLWSWRDLPRGAETNARALGGFAISALADGFWQWLIQESEDLRGAAS